MRYFLDTEYNGFGGELISLALVPEQGDQEFYAVLPLPDEIHPWVERNVVPYLGSVPPGHHAEPVSRLSAAVEIANYLARESEPVIVADWPEDVAQFCNLMVTGPGDMIEVRHLTFRLLPLSNFSTAANSKVPHNALHDARALRDHYRSME